jgi:steroid delta-isomerase-like uncharacterized protein
MKKQFMILPVVLILCFMVGCQDKASMAELEAMKAQSEVEEQNKALFKPYYDAWFNGDIEALKGIISPDFIWHTGLDPDSSLEEMIEHVNKQKAMYSNRTYSEEDIIAKGDKVVLRYIMRGAHTGDVEGFPATGNEFETSGIEIIRIESGKIVESWDAFDSLSHYEQLGMELKPKEEK